MHKTVPHISDFYFGMEKIPFELPGVYVLRSPSEWAIARMGTHDYLISKDRRLFPILYRDHKNVQVDERNPITLDRIPHETTKEPAADPQAQIGAHQLTASTISATLLIRTFRQAMEDGLGTEDVGYFLRANRTLLEQLSEIHDQPIGDAANQVDRMYLTDLLLEVAALAKELHNRFIA